MYAHLNKILKEKGRCLRYISMHISKPFTQWYQRGLDKVQANAREKVTLIIH